MNRAREHADRILASRLAKLDSLEPGVVVESEKSFVGKARQYLTVEAEHALHGPASAKDQAIRDSFCGPCENNKDGKCVRCGCGSNPRALVAVRITLAGAECPLPEPQKKWRRVNGVGGSLKTAGQAIAGVAATIAHQFGMSVRGDQGHR